MKSRSQTQTQTQRQMGMRMQRRVSILLVVTFSSFLLYATNNNYLLSTQPHIESQSEYALHVLKSSAPSPRGVKVFMDDLPRKFTYGVIRHYLRARGAPLNNDDSDLLYPGNQHSAEWFLFSDLLRPSNERSDSNSSVTVTLDPYDADLFYVPFFSSLSLVANPARQVASDNSYSYRDEDMQEQLVAWLESQLFWGRHQGRDHVIVCQDPNALYKVIHRLKNAVLLVSDFGRLKTEQASLVKDVILPYSHRINSYNGDIGIERRDSLLFFMGNRFRKEGGKVRDMLFQILEDEDDMIIKHGTQSRESRRLATQVQPGYLASMLRSVNSEKLLQYQRELKKVKKYFEYDKLDGAVDEIWRQVASKVPFIKMMIHREKRITKREEAKLDCSCLCSHRNYSSQTGLL